MPWWYCAATLHGSYTITFCLTPLGSLCLRLPAGYAHTRTHLLVLARAVAWLPAMVLVLRRFAQNKWFLHAGLHCCGSRYFHNGCAPAAWLLPTFMSCAAILCTANAPLALQFASRAWFPLLHTTHARMGLVTLHSPHSLPCALLRVPLPLQQFPLWFKQ